MNKGNLLVLGSICSTEDMDRRPYANVPGTLWLSGFCRGLQHLGLNPIVVGHVPERIFPYGKVFLNPKKTLDYQFDQRPVKYINLPLVREPSLVIGYYQTTKKILKTGPAFVVITYNPMPYNVISARFAQKKFGAKWISILLDPPSDTFSGDWEEYLCNYGIADVNVFLSWWAYSNFPYPNKYHFDVGCDKAIDAEWNFKQSGPIKLLYSGKIEDSYGGSRILAKTIQSISDPRMEFIICGKGSCSMLNEVARVDKRIKYMGFVSANQLDALCKEADGFINVRDPEHRDNLYIFPSKLAFYLKYAKPIFSIKTPGISPVYDDLVYFPQENNGNGLANIILSFFSSDFHEWGLRRQRIFKYIKNNGSWKSKCRELITYCESLGISFVS